MLIKSVKLVLEGMVSGMSYKYNGMTNHSQYPTFLIYQFTNNCNSHCLMCNIWKKKSQGELSITELKKIFKKPVFKELRWVNLTGGEPFLRDDIVDAVNILNTLPSFEGVAIPSNGFLTDRIVRKTKEMLKVLGKDKFLSITLSIDGFEETHDEIRGVPGAYRKVMKTLDKLLKLKTKHSNFNVGVQPTISKRNIDEMERFYHHMKKKVGSVGFAVMLESEGYYSNIDSKIALNQNDKKRIARFFKKILRQDPQYGFYYSKLIELFKTGERKFGCLAGYITMYMDPFGNISPCPVLSCDKKYLFGNIKEHNIWFNKRAGTIRKKLVAEPVCDTCSMMCDFINVAKVEFYEHALWMLLHPVVLARLLKKISNEKNPYF